MRPWSIVLLILSLLLHASPVASYDYGLEEVFHSGAEISRMLSGYITAPVWNGPDEDILRLSWVEVKLGGSEQYLVYCEIESTGEEVFLSREEIRQPPCTPIGGPFAPPQEAVALGGFTWLKDGEFALLSYKPNDPVRRVFIDCVLISDFEYPNRSISSLSFAQGQRNFMGMISVHEDPMGRSPGIYDLLIRDEQTGRIQRYSTVSREDQKYSLSLSPNGHFAAWSSRSRELYDGEAQWMRSDVAVMKLSLAPELASKQVKYSSSLSDTLRGSDEMNPSWDPTGLPRIAFFRKTELSVVGSETEVIRLCVADVDDDGTLKNLLQFNAEPIVDTWTRGPVWAHDGSGIYFVQDDVTKGNPIGFARIPRDLSFSEAQPCIFAKQVPGALGPHEEVSASPNGNLLAIVTDNGRTLITVTIDQ